MVLVDAVQLRSIPAVLAAVRLPGGVGGCGVRVAADAVLE
jgi:hypothetical protein